MPTHPESRDPVPERRRDSIAEALITGAIRGAEWLGIDATLALGAALGRAWYLLRAPRSARVRVQLVNNGRVDV